jgi:hypothetical protein
MRVVSPDAICTRHVKLSVEFGIEGMVWNPVRPIRSVRFENATHRLAEIPTGSRSLSKYTLDVDVVIGTGPYNTECKREKLNVSKEACDAASSCIHDHLPASRRPQRVRDWLQHVAAQVEFESKA